MALNPYGGFNHRSPLSPCPSDPPLDLASDCIRDYFGPSVQTVADCLRSRGPSTIAQLVSRIRSQCRRVVNEERERLVERLPAAATMGGSGSVGAESAAARKPRINKAVWIALKVVCCKLDLGIRFHPILLPVEKVVSLA